MSAVDVSYRVDGQGPPLYMVHGIGSRKTVWDGLIPGLREHFTCVRYDLRGHGMSPVPPTPYSLEQLVEDLDELRKRLGHGKIHVIGHSLGGMIAPAYARKHPERVLSVGLLSTAAGRSADDRAKLRAVGEAMRDSIRTGRGVKAVVCTLIERWYTDEFIAARPEAVEARIKQVIDTPEEVFLSVFQIYAQTEMKPWLHEITHPCLVLTGALDGGCSPRLNAVMTEELPNAEMVILDNLKHSILIEAPERVLEPLKNFLLTHGS